MSTPAPQSSNFATVGLAAGGAAWAYYPTLAGLVRMWDVDPNYSHGFIIPLVALGLAGFRFWESPAATQPAPASGLALLALAAALRGAGAYYYITPLDHGSLLLTLAGLVLLAGGWPWLRRVWPGLAVLAFAFPIPSSLGGSNLVAGLQDIATKASTFLLQAFGTTAYREGNVILTPACELGIVEACSGLKMLMVFCALAVVTAALMPLGRVQRVVLAASAVPLALVCNVVRITVAGMASGSLGREMGHFVFHDLAGWLMVPLAFALLGVEIVILAKLVRLRTAAGPS